MRHERGTTMVPRRSTGGVHEKKVKTDQAHDEESSGYSSSDQEDSKEEEFDGELEQLASATFVDIKSRFNASKSDNSESDSDADSEGSSQSEDGKVEEKQGPSHYREKFTPAAAPDSEISESCKDSQAAQFFIDKTPGLSRSFDSYKSDSDSSSNIDSQERDSDGNDSDKHLSMSNAVISTSSVSTKSKRKTGLSRPQEKKILDEGLGLSTSLESGLDPSDVYVNADFGVAQIQCTRISGLQLNKDRSNLILKKSVVGPDFEKRDQIPPYQESLNQMRKQRKLDKEKTKGKGWFDLPAQEMTEEKKNDLMVLQMRRALDPKHFYKGRDMRGLPKYFQVGRVVETAADFYNSRIPKKQRKSTLVDELLADAEFRKYNKRKYAEILESKHPTNKGALKHMKRLKKKK